MRWGRRAAAGRAVRLLFRSEPAAVRRALTDAMETLAGNGLPPEDLQVLELVLAEVLNNVVEHAYAGRGDGVVELSVLCGGEAVGCAVVDRGNPMPGAALPCGGLPPAGSDGAALPEGGFGWFLIRALTQELRYVRTSGRNRLTFAVPLGRARAQAQRKFG